MKEARNTVLQGRKSERALRRELERLEIPGEHEARVRAWDVVRAAFGEREVGRAPRRRVRPVLALAAALALVAAAVSDPGRAVLDSVRDAIGIQRARPALFSLPAEGRLLVDSDEGPWVVHEDGSKRLLGRYAEAAWSPHGLFVVAARANELAALEPDGDVRWKLSRPRVTLPAWGGTRSDTRIAYLSRGALRVVGGDGRGDRASCADVVAPVRPQWRPEAGGRHVLAFVAPNGQVNLYGVDRCELYWRSRPMPAPQRLSWSADGARLLVVTPGRLVVFAWNRRRPLSTRRIPGVVDAAFAPAGRLVAVLRARDVLLVDADRPRALPQRLFAGAGRFTSIAWSPDARWLLVAWRDADQWVFVRSAGVRKLEAVSAVSAQFDSRAFPSIAGWCCR